MAVSYRRRRGPRIGLPLALGGAALLAAAVVGVLWATGVLGGEPKGRKGPRPGQVAVILAPRDLPAYTRLTRDELVDPSTGTFRTVYLDAEQIPEGMLRTVDALFGRVLKGPKRANYAFFESEMLPEGTRGGLVGGIPPGKRALRIDASRMPGLFDLEIGDRFDLLATRTVDDVEDTVRERLDQEEAILRSIYGGAAGGVPRPLPGTLVAPWEREQAAVEVLVEDGVVVKGVHVREVPTTSTSLTSGTRTRTIPVQEAVLAVDADEVAPLMEALALEVALVCVPRSGQPDEAGAEKPIAGRTPEIPDPRAGDDAARAGPDVPDVTFVETVTGDRRQYRVVPKGSEGGEPE